MAAQTEVTLVLDSTSLFEALRRQVGDWSLGEHVFDPAAEELALSYDVGGTGRVALTVAFELDAEQMSRLLQDARPTT